MPKGYWGVILAAGIAVGSLGQAQEETQNAQGDAPAEQQPAQALPIPLPVDIVEDQAAAQARKRGEAEAAQREKDDLVAQQGMNSATQRMARYAVISTVLVGIGTALLFVTLWLTRQANKAAQEAVAVTRDIGQRQVRAYLSVGDPEVIGIGKGTPALFRLCLSNTGQSPARNVVIRARMGTCDSVGSHKFRFKGETPEMFADIGGSNKGWFEFSRGISEDVLEKVKLGEWRIFWAGYIRYTDTFRRTRRSTFYFHLVPSEIDEHGRAALYATGRHNRSS